MDFLDGPIIIRGRYAYIAGLHGHLSILDLNDPIHPELIGMCNTYLHEVESLEIHDNYVYINNFSGHLSVIDIRDPTNPLPIGRLSVTAIIGADPDPAQSCFAIANNYVFAVIGTRGLVVLDINAPINSSFIHAITMPSWNAYDITLNEFYAYLSHSRGIQVIDVSDPRKPIFLGSYETFWSAQEVFIEGDYAYVRDMRKLHVIDISDPANLKHLGSHEAPEWTKGMAKNGNHIYLALSHGLQVIDVSNSNLLELVGSYKPSSSWVSGVAVKGDYAFLAEMDHGLSLLDISDPSNPKFLKKYTFVGRSLGVSIFENNAYVPCNLFLQVIDITDPINPILIGSYERWPNTQKITVSEDNTYIVGEFGLQIVDFSDPAYPSIIGEYSQAVFVNGIAVSGSYAFLTAGDELLIVQASPTECPPVIFINTSTLKITIPDMLRLGLCDVIVRNPDGESAILSNGFLSWCEDCNNDGYTEAEGDCADNDYDGNIDRGNQKSQRGIYPIYSQPSPWIHPVLGFPQLDIRQRSVSQQIPWSIQNLWFPWAPQINIFNSVGTSPSSITPRNYLNIGSNMNWFQGFHQNSLNQIIYPQSMMSVWQFYQQGFGFPLYFY